MSAGGSRGTHQHLHDQHAPTLSQGAPAGLEDANRRRVLPLVEEVGDEEDIALGHRLARVARGELAAALQSSVAHQPPATLEGVWEVEEHRAKLGVALE